VVVRTPQLNDKEFSGYYLWHCIQFYLEFAEKARIGEIMEFLSWMKFPTTRQAVESAIQTHSKVFRVARQGREKYIALKK
jgi:hypothetical protein